MLKALKSKISLNSCKSPFSHQCFIDVKLIGQYHTASKGRYLNAHSGTDYRNLITVPCTCNFNILIIGFTCSINVFIFFMSSSSQVKKRKTFTIFVADKLLFHIQNEFFSGDTTGIIQKPIIHYYRKCKSVAPRRMF